MDRSLSVIEQLIRVAHGKPDAVAVVQGERTLTYGALLTRAEGVADELLERGARPDVRVGVLAGRSIEYIVGAVGVLRAGACYVPIDPEHPRERRELLIADAGMLTVVDEAGIGAAAQLPSRPRSRSADPPGPTDLVYVIYTSGSTGRPKGVAVEHRNLAHLVAWHHAAFGTSHRSRTMLVAGVGFDAAAWELWAALTAGATIVVPDPADRRSPQRLRDTIVESGITEAFLPTPLAEAVLGLPWPAGCALRLLLTGGDLLKVRPPDGLPFQLVNNYGPTETTVVATSGPVRPGSGPPTIGRPIAGATVEIRDVAGAAVPDGAVGELYVGGAGVARGYLRHPDLTAEHFLDEPTGRVYRTGDRVRRLPDGELEFLGRLDDQVQVQGHRVEPGEVEATLAEHPAIGGCAVVAVDLPGGTPHLVGFYVPRRGERDPAAGELRRWLAARLPAVLVPGVLHQLAKMPLTQNDKIDRTVLRAHAGRLRAAAPAATPTEALLVEIWSGVFGFAVGADEPFDALGGHSLTAARIASAIEERCGATVAPELILGAGSVAKLAALIERRDAAAPRPARPLAGTADPWDRALSSGQARYWLLDQTGPDPVQQVVTLSFAIDGKLDVAAASSTITAIAARHPALCTAIVDTPTGPQQQMRAAEAPGVTVVDVRGQDEPDVPGLLMTTLASAPFDLSAPPPIRAAFVRTGVARWTLGIAVHHVAFDGWSVGVLLREFERVYAAVAGGRPVPAAPVRASMADVAAWEREHARDPKLLEYWRSALAGAPAALDLPFARRRPARPTGRGDTVAHEFPSTLDAAVDRLATAAGTTTFTVVFAALAAVMHRFTGEPDVVIGTPAAVRDHAQLEDVIGCFVNPLALRLQSAGDLSFGELVQRAHAAVTGGFAHRSLPFEHIVDAVGLSGTRDRHPVFQVMLVVQRYETTQVRLPDATLRYTGELHPDRARFDLSIVLDRGELVAEYASDLYAAADVRRLLALLVRTLETADLGTRLDELDLLPQVDRDLLLTWGDGGPAHRNGPVHRRIAGPADKPAVICDGDVVTYSELVGAVNALAWTLRMQGVAGNVPVAVGLDRSVDAVVAMLAVHRAGGVYVPLDLRLPDPRLAAMLADARPAVVVCRSATADRLRALTGGPVAVVHPDRTAHRADPPPDTTGDDDLADIVFTSGSTGVPKGVLITHNGLANLVDAKVQRFDVRPDSRVLQFVSFGFSVAISDVYMTLTAGATLVVRGEAEVAGSDLVALVRRHEITNLVLPASVLAAMPMVELPSLRAIAVGGEMCAQAVVDAWAPGRHFVNSYGPTEATTAATTGSCRAGDAHPTIGRPLPGVRIHVLDERGRPCPVGAAGELCIGGAGVARGYLDRPDLTAERFVPDPVTGGRMYRTGDLARWTDDGRLVLLGRADDQVNVRGARTELGEVEVALRAHPDVVDATAAVHRHPTAGEVLVGYLVGDAERLPEASAMREFLSAHLPEHSVPTAFVALAELPRTTTGKVDRKALPSPDPAACRGGRAAAGPIEEIIAEVWTEVLGTRPSADEDFFSLGGQSLSAADVAARLRHRFEIPLPTRAVFDAPTVAALAAVVETALLEDLA
ncbi:non-ribosomal peptide synthetase [Pseudonocardia sp. TRM90224]|uniref:non-ribosomal peptide synthetase n=1 Tax=Pseudonocardia sp. TRM90224 TaxID=2812678 RepID=UPI001E5E4FBE|nr:non-ribosomal peptide synthetase [Pseudonocardia sp. TRM90224]